MEHLEVDQVHQPNLQNIVLQVMNMGYPSLTPLKEYDPL